MASVPMVPHVFLNLLPYHILAYGLLLGTQVYQSFVVTKLCFLHLPRPQFTQLQKRVFPVYFALQTALTTATVLTVPRTGLLPLVGASWTQWVPLVLTLATSLANLLVYGPRTGEIMMERVRQATKDGPKADGESPPSTAMQTANRQFSRAHAMAIHLNAIGMVATVWYGFSLGSRLVVVL